MAPLSRLPLLALGLLACAPAAAQGGAAPRPSLAEPGISPDGAEIAFVSGGDVWTVPARGGEARLLVSHPADERRPLYSPDGRRLAFVSTRTGNGDVYVLTFATGEVRRMTHDDAAEQLDGWSRDGKWLYFSSTGRDVAGMNDLFRVSAEGGTPMQVSADRYTNEYFSAESPDGARLAFTARGIVSGQWWRLGSSHLDQSEIWLLTPGALGGYRQLTPRGARHVWPLWSADGRTLYYVSDRGGAQNFWAHPLDGEPRQLTRFREGRVLWPSISRDGRAIAFERDLRIWRLDPATGAAAEVPVTLRGAPTTPETEHRTFTGDFQELALSPDGKKVAFTVRGEVFAASAKDGGDAVRVTTTPEREMQVAWAPDSRMIVYVSDRGGTPHLYTYDFDTREEQQVTRGAGKDASPVFSPDGKWIAFTRDGRELRVLRVTDRTERRLAAGYLDEPPFVAERSIAWSPDGRWIAYLSGDEQSFTNAYVVPLAGGPARQVSFLANVFGNTLSWSPDGSFLILDTGQRTEATQVVRVDLAPRVPRFREDQFRDLFREESPRNATPPAQRPQTTERRTAAPDSAAADSVRGSRKPERIVFEEIRRRLTSLPVGVDVDAQAISPDGKLLLLTATAANQQNLYVYPLDELSREPAVARQITSTSGSKSAAQFSPDGKEVWYLEQGRIHVVPLESRQPRQLSVSAEMAVDFGREKLAVFREGWRWLRDHFYDPRMHGVDWEAVGAAYEPHAAGARTPEELRRVMSLMVGELNASHLGVAAPGGGGQPANGRLGLRFDRAEYEREGRLRVTEVVPLGPAALAGIVPGDVLAAVDGVRVDARTSLDALLERKVGRRVALSVLSGGREREVAVRPVNLTTEKGLLYRAWVEANRAYVDRVSGGKLGYVHMFDMSWNSLQQLHLDLDAEAHARQGVVVDVRNNNGGFVNVYALDVFARRPYLDMTIRGQPTAGARTMLGQRALEAPTVLVTNQHSLSDAEDFTEGYRALGLGKVVGEPTAGWIVFTWNLQLVDGSVIRLPRQKVATRAGVNMELEPRPVDVPVTRPIGETLTGRDTQLDAAVRELLARTGGE